MKKKVKVRIGGVREEQSKDRMHNARLGIMHTNSNVMPLVATVVK